MKRKLNFVTGALSLVFAAGLSGCGGGNEKEFGENLAKRICTIMNEEKGRGRSRSISESVTFLDPDQELKMELEAPGIFVFLDPTQRGTITFDDYESDLGDLKGTLSWKLRANLANGSRVSSSTRQMLEGTLIDDDDNNIDVSISFDVNSEDEDGKNNFDISSIQLGQSYVQVGKKERVDFSN